MTPRASSSADTRLGVCMLIQGFYPRVGGAERQIQGLIPHLRQRGVRVMVVTRRYAGLMPRETVAGVPVLRMPIHGNRITASLSYTLTSLATIFRLRRHIDVIHAHELLSPTLTAVFGKLIARKPVVAKILRGGELGDVSVLRRGALGAFRLWLFRALVDVFIAISEEIEQELMATGVARHKIARIPNGVDTERLKPAPAENRAKLRSELQIGTSPCVLYVGRIEREKGLDDLLNAWPSVRARLHQALLLIVGDGQHRPSLESRGVEGVRFVGTVSDPLPYLQAADCFVLPSHTEGLSNALLEAIAAELPCVVTAIGGNVDLIRPDISGWVVEPDNAVALARALVSALSLESRAARAAAARANVVANYSMSSTADALRDVYARLAVRPDK